MVGVVVVVSFRADRASVPFWHGDGTRLVPCLETGL
jgi:hypothetical protein